jgi:WD40-like Beta Propeller Repeat
MGFAIRARVPRSSSWVIALVCGALFAAQACTERGELLGRIALQTDGAGSEAGAADTGATNAADAESALPTTPHFATPVLVSALSDTSSIDEDPTFTGDLLELYFMSTRAGTKDVWTSRRAAQTDPWGTPTRVTELDSTSDDWSPGVSLDGLSIWFATDRVGGVGKIWLATRPARIDAWGAPGAVRGIAGNDVDFAPAVDATNTLLFFSSNRTGSAGFDLYSSSRPSAAAAWSTPMAIPGLNSASDEYDPFVAQGGLVVFFTSMRSGAGDIYWSARRSTDEAFESPTRLDDLDSDAYDSDSTLSPDLSYMMFSSTRSGNAEIYETHSLK